MPEPSVRYQIGSVDIIAQSCDITELAVDAIVQPAGTSKGNMYSQWASQWVRDADGAHSKLAGMAQGLIERDLTKHAPLRLETVVVTPAHHFPAKYLLHAVVVDWEGSQKTGQKIFDSVIEGAARRCIEIAVALGVESIAFTPWGTKVAGQDPAHITAIMVRTITAQVRQHANRLKRIYLVSNEPSHYRWFADRAYIFNLISSQVSEIRQLVDTLSIDDSSRSRLLELLDNVQKNTVVFNQFAGGDITGGDKVGGDSITAGNIESDGSVAIGKSASAQEAED